MGRVSFDKHFDDIAICTNREGDWFDVGMISLFQIMV